MFLFFFACKMSIKWQTGGESKHKQAFWTRSQFSPKRFSQPLNTRAEERTTAPLIKQTHIPPKYLRFRKCSWLISIYWTFLHTQLVSVINRTCGTNLHVFLPLIQTTSSFTIRVHWHWPNNTNEYTFLDLYFTFLTKALPIQFLLLNNGPQTFSHPRTCLIFSPTKPTAPSKSAFILIHFTPLKCMSSKLVKTELKSASYLQFCAYSAYKLSTQKLL